VSHKRFRLGRGIPHTADAAGEHVLVHRIMPHQRSPRPRGVKMLVFFEADKYSLRLTNLGGWNMDLFLVAIVAALLITVAVTFAGLLTMAGGGKRDQELSTPLMWARVGAQAFTILLLVTAILAR
jgi:hypothetical protein